MIWCVVLLLLFFLEERGGRNESDRLVGGGGRCEKGKGGGFDSRRRGGGGGIFLSPLLLLKQWATPKAAAATAALFIWVNSASGLLGATASNQLVLESRTLLPFITAVLLGGLIGSRYGSNHARQSTVRNLLVAVLLLASVKRISELIF